MDHLRGGMQGDPAVTVPFGYGAMRLHRVLVGPVADESFFPDIVCLGKTFINITEMMIDPGIDVVFVFVVKQPGGSVLHCFLRIEDGGQFLVFHLYQLHGPVTGLLIHCGHSCYNVSHITHLLLGQDVFIITGRGGAPGDIRHIVTGKHGHDPWQCFCFRYIY